MATLTREEIGRLLQPFRPSPSPKLLASLELYLDLLVRWNTRTNLTAIRDPSEMVVRHFGESFFAAQHVGSASTVLDYGSGAGFPGIPLALLHPDVTVTLAESQQKKVSFLREAIRTLDLKVELWPSRVEDLPSARCFDCVTLRAVDDPDRALFGAAARASTALLLMTTTASISSQASPPGFGAPALIPIPCSRTRVLALFSRLSVPRGTST